MNNLTKAEQAALNSSIQEIKSQEISCAAIKEGKIFFKDKGRGVSSLIKLLNTNQTNSNNPADISNSSLIIADKIIGKAAAMLSHLMGAKAVYGEIMSKAALTYLTEQNIKAYYREQVPQINNRTNTGICPIENAVLTTTNPTQALTQIKATITQLMSTNQTQPQK